MEDLFEERRPESCNALGLDCHRCVGTSAETIASVCRGMTDDGVSKIFLQLYPSQGCAPMAAVFHTAYAQASIPRKPMLRAVAAA